MYCIKYFKYISSHMKLMIRKGNIKIWHAKLTQCARPHFVLGNIIKSPCHTQKGFSSSLCNGIEEFVKQTSWIPCCLGQEHPDPPWGRMAAHLLPTNSGPGSLIHLTFKTFSMSAPSLWPVEVNGPAKKSKFISSILMRSDPRTTEQESYF